MSTLEIRTRRWTRKEYDRLIELGILHEDEPIELVDGQMVVREPKHAPHAVTTGLVSDALRAAFGRGWHVRVQEPIALDDESEPEPDVSVVRGAPRDYLGEHPARPALIVEIAMSSLAFDRTRKGGLYARAAVTDYWIVNLVDRVLEVYREPAPDATAPFGWAYHVVRRLHAEESIAPLAAPTANIAVADLLP